MGMGIRGLLRNTISIVSTETRLLDQKDNHSRAMQKTGVTHIYDGDLQ